MSMSSQIETLPVQAPVRPKAKHLPELDGLRAAAILQVLVWHFYVTIFAVPISKHGAWAWLNRLLSLTWSGVDLFFVLSGFLIGGILLDSKGSPNYFKTFFIRRICRIIPVYYLFISPMFLLPLLIPTHQIGGLNWSGGPFPAWFYLCFLQNFGMAKVNTLTGYTAITWSLAIEEQFYILLPALIYLVPMKRLPYWIVSGILLSPLLRALILWLSAGKAVIVCYVLLPCRWDSLLLGVLAALLLRVDTWRTVLHAQLPRMKYGLAILTVGYIASALTQDFGSPLITLVGYSWLALLYITLLLIVVLSREGGLKSFFGARIFFPIATISYCLYLFHAPVAILVHYLVLHQKPPRLGDLKDVVAGILGLAISLIVATLSWHCIEKRAIRFGHRFKY
jgi:peptidoglycan/LPS O-acetylase OafA/YrhL